MWHFYYFKHVTTQKSSAVGFCKYTSLGTIPARDFMYLYKLFLHGDKDSNLWSECESRSNSVVLNMLCSECQADCINDIPVPGHLTFFQINEQGEKKDYSSCRQTNYVDWMEIFKNHRESGNKYSPILCISYAPCYLKSVEINKKWGT